MDRKYWVRVDYRYAETGPERCVVLEVEAPDSWHAITFALESVKSTAVISHVAITGVE